VTSDGGFSGNPFPGLRAFEPDEEHLFFGRESQIDELLAHLRRRRFVAVIGASGSGKSSLVRAGLLPALHGGFMAAASRWCVALMRPGRSPMASLARALDSSGLLGEGSGDALLRVGLIQAVLERGALGLVEVVADARPSADESLLILVDQLEELFRFKATDAVAFVKLLLAAVAQSRYPIYVVITMRSDFLGEVSQFRQLPEVISESLFLVPRLTRTQFQRAIEGPIRVAGGRIAPRLTNRLLNDLEDDADQLPVLQHALMRTWDAHSAHRTSDVPLDIEDLERIGALSEALSLHGDEIYAALRTDRLREVAEKLFRCLTDRGEDNRGVRRPARFADVCAIVDAGPAEVREVADAFRAPGCSFLMPPYNVPIDDDTALDISHESLMRIWKRLQRWVNEEAQSAQIYRRLAGAAQLYAEQKTALWRDPELQIAANWRDQNRPTPAWGERIVPGFQFAMQFLDASVAERSRQRRERTARLRASLVALAVIAVALMALSAVAFSQWRIADASLEVERAERLADVSEQGSASLQTSALLAADAYGMQKTPRTTSAMLDELLRLRALRGAAVASVARVAFAQRGRLLAVATKTTAESGSQLVLFDALNLAALAQRRLTNIAHVGPLCGSPDAGWFALSDGQSIFLFDGIQKGAPLLTGSWDAGRIDAMACLPHRRAVLIADVRNGLRTLDFDSATQRRLVSSSSEHVADILVSPSGRFAATLPSGPGRIDLFDLRLQRQLGAENAHGASCPAAQSCLTDAFSPDEQRLAWLDGRTIRSASVPSLGAIVSRPCRCFGDATLAYGIDGSGPRAINAAAGSMPAYDANTEVFVTYDDRGILEHALDNTVAPALGMQKEPVWPGSFASVDNRLVLAGTSAIHVYNLERYRSQLASAANVSRVVRISDPGDGVHAVAFDYRSGLVRIITLAPAVSVAEVFRAHPAAIEHDAFADAPEISYDPIEQTFTEAWSGGIARYAMNGRDMGEDSWSALASAATLPSWYPELPYVLSSRGSYVALVPPSPNQARVGQGTPGAVSPTVALISTKGGLIAQFASTPFVSIDERFTLGLLTSDSDTAPGLYRLPRADRLPELDLPDTTMAALSPNAQTIAYATSGDSSRETGIQLVSVATNSRIGPVLPSPPRAQSIDNLAFSDDARYLIASYRIGETEHVIVVYSIDPADWQRTLCLLAGANLAQSERIVSTHGIEPVDACKKYASEMIR
jgi:energy-coupling factor transporter ATP-binding protein EcfA2